MGTILQWNCRGLMTNHPELCLLSQQYNPVAMCLQETHIADISKVSFEGFTPYHRLDNSHDRASGGSSLLIRNDVIHPFILNDGQCVKHNSSNKYNWNGTEVNSISAVI